MEKQLHTIHISIDELSRAVDHAKKFTTEWQAECIEIAMLPKIARRWKQVNSNLPELGFIRHAGKKYVDGDCDFNSAIGDDKAWAEYAGYRLVFFKDETGKLYGYNGVSSDHYGHSAGVAWDGGYSPRSNG